MDQDGVVRKGEWLDGATRPAVEEALGRVAAAKFCMSGLLDSDAWWWVRFAGSGCLYSFSDRVRRMGGCARCLAGERWLRVSLDYWWGTGGYTSRVWMWLKRCVFAGGQVEHDCAAPLLVYRTGCEAWLARGIWATVISGEAGSGNDCV
jgi:hypothetical protein